MIKIQILAEGEKVADSFTKKNTTLIENAIVIRRLEEIKQQLLEIEYDSEFEAQEDLGWNQKDMEWEQGQIWEF